jgi:hypothetical protein
MIKYKVLNAVEVCPNTLARGKKQKDSDTSGKPASLRDAAWSGLDIYLLTFGCKEPYLYCLLYLW